MNLFVSLILFTTFLLIVSRVFQHLYCKPPSPFLIYIIVHHIIVWFEVLSHLLEKTATFRDRKARQREDPKTPMCLLSVNRYVCVR